MGSDNLVVDHLPRFSN